MCAGRIRKLDFTSYDLNCPFPAAEFAQFQALETLILAQNPNMTGTLSTIFDTLAANLTSLKTLDLSQDSGLSSRIGNSGICSLATVSTKIRA